MMELEDGHRLRSPIRNITWNHPFVFSITALVIVGLTKIFLEILGEPTQRGFYCDDETIRYPFGDNTVTETTITICAILIPLILVIPTELFVRGLKARSRLQLWRWRIPLWLKTSFQFYSVYLLGLGFSQVISEIGKFTIGRLRPHFIAVCQPNVDCSLPVYVGKYIQNFSCLGNDPDDIFEARLSFPSGHSAGSFYAAIYIVVYLHYCKPLKRIGLLRVLVQFVFLATAWWVSLSRIMDNWHHWSDVVVGALLGTFTAIFMIIYVSDLTFKSKDETDSEFLPLRKTNSVQ